MKSLLMIDTPCDCYDCPCYYEDKDTCEALLRKIGSDDVKPEWCPLRPIPENDHYSFCHDPEDDYEFGYVDGYNDCLKDIKGETE